MNLLETYQRTFFAPSKLVVIPPPRGASDARGGFATPAAPALLPPGYIDPRVRAFTKTIPDPAYANDPNFQNLPEEQKQDLLFRIPPPEDLDRVALFAPPAPGFTFGNWPGGPCSVPQDQGCTEGNWSDIVALGPAAVKAALGWWRQAVALGPLPEDDDFDDSDPNSPAANWPRQGITHTRKIYFWGYGKDGKLYQHMQLQKDDGFGSWKILNKWGQNLTFVLEPSTGKWIAGWDAGDWFTQNKIAIAAGIQIAFQAIVTVLSLGTAAPGTAAVTAATVAGVLAANQALGAAMTGIATGNWDAALASVIKMGTDLANVPDVAATIAQNKDVGDFVKSAPMQAFGKITAGMKWPPTFDDMVKRAQVLAKDIPISTDLLKDARSQVPGNLLTWFDVAYQKGKAATLAGVPWYAQGVFQFGATLGAFVDAKTYYSNVAESGAGDKMLTLKQALAISQQQAQQGVTSWRQALNQTAGVHAPRTLPGPSSRSPAPASAQTSTTSLIVGGGLIALLALLAKFFLR